MYLHLLNDLETWSYMHATVVLWGTALLYRIGVIMYNGLPRATLKDLDDDATLIEITAKNRLRWSAGQFYFIRFVNASLQPWSSHPFTVASTKNDGHLSFIVRRMSGFTKRLSISNKTEPVRVLLDGPYGAVTTKSFYACTSVLFIAGGSGVTFVVPLMMDLLQKKKAGSSLCQKIHFVWAVKKNCKCQQCFHILAMLLKPSHDSCLLVVPSSTPRPH